MSKSTPLATLLQNRGALLQILVAAVILAIGVNLLSSAIEDSLSSKSALWGLSFLLLGVSAILLAKQTIPSRHVNRDMSGFLIFRTETKELIEVPRYDYSQKFKSFLEGLFAENSAPKGLWNSDFVDKAFNIDVKAGKGGMRQTEAGQLIVEATEYYVLELLSTHLSDYFNQSELASEQLQELSREDVPDILFKNRFLDTFSRPMRERAAFVNDSKNDSMLSRAILSYGPNGIRYSRFDLTLPVGAQVKRLSPSSISIETPKFKLKMTIDFRGFSASLPYDFTNLYLGGVNFSDVRAYEIKLSTNVEFRPRALLSRSGWDYHAWLDSFLAKLESRFDGDEFLKEINWEAAATVARVVHQKLRPVDGYPTKNGPASMQKTDGISESGID